MPLCLSLISSAVIPSDSKLVEVLSQQNNLKAALVLPARRAALDLDFFAKFF